MYIMENEQSTKKHILQAKRVCIKQKGYLHVQYPCEMIFPLVSWSIIHSTMSSDVLPQYFLTRFGNELSGYEN